MPVDVWQDVVFLIEVIAVLVPVDQIGIDGPHIVLIWFLAVALHIVRRALVVPGFFEIVVYNQVGYRSCTDFFPSCCHTFIKLGDRSWFLWLLVLLVLSCWFDYTCLAKELVVGYEWDHWSEGNLNTRCMEPVLAACVEITIVSVGV